VVIWEVTPSAPLWKKKRGGFLEIEVRDWEPFNPKRDQKTYTWLRLDHDLVRGPKFYGLSNLEKYVSILLLCEASKNGKGRFWLDVEWFCDEVAKEPVEFVLALIDKLSTKNKRGETFLIVHSRDEDPNQGNLLEEPEPHDSARPDATAERPDTTPTDGRTDVTNGRTDGRSLKQAQGKTFTIDGLDRSTPLSPEEISKRASEIMKTLNAPPRDGLGSNFSQAVGA
jgi:hypothetical protein